MPSFTKDKGGKHKLTSQTINPDQAAEKAKQSTKPSPPPASETETN